MNFLRFAGKVVRDASIGVYIDIGAEKDHGTMKFSSPFCADWYVDILDIDFLSHGGDLSCHPTFFLALT